MTTTILTQAPAPRANHKGLRALRDDFRPPVADSINERCPRFSVPSHKGLDLLIPVRLGPTMSRFPGCYQCYGLPIIRLEDSAFHETFKSGNDVFE